MNRFIFAFVFMICQYSWAGNFPSLKSYWQKLPTLAQLRADMQKNPHATSPRFIEGAFAVGKVYVLGLKDKSVRVESLEFLKSCAEAKNFPQAIRFVCNERLTDLSRL